MSEMPLSTGKEFFFTFLAAFFLATFFTGFFDFTAAFLVVLAVDFFLDILFFFIRQPLTSKELFKLF